MPDALTEYLQLVKPEIGGSTNSWGYKMHQNFEKIDTAIKNLNSQGLTATPAYVTTVGIGEGNYKCDGVQDDEQIQKAIDDMAVLDGGATIRILPGTYDLWKQIMPKTNTQLQMDDGVILKCRDQFVTKLSQDYNAGSNVMKVQSAAGFVVGTDIGIIRGTSSSMPESGYKEGQYSRIAQINGTTLTLDTPIPETFLASDNCAIFGHHNAIFVSSADNVKITGGEIDGNKQSLQYKLVNIDNDLNGIASEECNNLIIDSVTVHDFWFQGIHPWGTHNGYQCRNCTVYNCDAGGIVLDTIDETCFIANCIGYNNGQAGLKALDCNNVIIIGGQFYNNVQEGIAIEHQYTNYRVLVMSVVCNNNQHGIVFGSVVDGVIIGGVCSGNTVAGIEFKNSTKYCSINNIAIHDSPIGVLEHTYSDFNAFGESITFRDVPTPIVSNGLNTKISSGSTVPEYSTGESSSGTFNLPSNIPQNAFQLYLTAQSIANLMGEYGDVGAHIVEPLKGTAVSGGIPSNWWFGLPENLRQADLYYVNWSIYLTGGTGAGQQKRCSNYNGTDNVIEGYGPWDVIPDNTTQFELYPPESYHTAGYHGPLYIDRFGYVRYIDGYYCLDCPEGDWVYPNTINSNHIKLNTIIGHKYLVLLKGRSPADGGITIKQRSTVDNRIIKYNTKTDLKTWTTVALVSDPVQEEITIFTILSVNGYPFVYDKGYVKDIMVIDLNVAGDSDLGDEEIYNKYENYTFTSGNSDAHSVPGRIRIYKDKYLRNYLETDGNIDEHYTQYSIGGTYHYTTIWREDEAKIMDGYKCIDGYYSDYDWDSGNIRSHYIRRPTLTNHKYLIRATVKGYTQLQVIDSTLGTTITQNVRNNPEWGQQFITTTSDGKDLICLLRSAYLEHDKGYYREIMLFDLTFLGDDGFSDADLQIKYGGYPYFDDILYRPSDQYYNLYVPRLRKVRNTSDSVTPDGVLNRKVGYVAVDDNINIVLNPRMNIGSQVADGFITESSGVMTATFSVDNGQKISVATIDSGEYASVYQDVNVNSFTRVSIGFAAKTSDLVQSSGFYHITLLNADGNVINDYVSGVFSGLEYTSIIKESIFIPAGVSKVRVVFGIKGIGTGGSGSIWVKNYAVIETTELEMDEEGEYLRYKLPNEVHIQLAQQFAAMAGYEDPVYFEKIWQQYVVVDSALYKERTIYPEISPIAAVKEAHLIGKDGTLTPIDESRIHIDSNGTSFTVDNMNLNEVYLFIYEHNEEGISPNIEYKAPFNTKAQSLVNSELAVNVDQRLSAKVEALESRMAALLDILDGTGLVLTTPDKSKMYKISVDNSGGIVTTLL